VTAGLAGSNRTSVRAMRKNTHRGSARGKENIREELEEKAFSILGLLK